MKSFFIPTIITMLMSCSTNNKNEATSIETQPNEEIISDVTYDAQLAEKAGADEYGMKSYVMAFLKRGPNRPTDSIERAALQKAHMENIGILAEQGKLILAGPFLDDGELRGIYLFDTPSVDSARAYTATDPAIQKGSLVMELMPWYGSAALMKVNELHKKMAKTAI